MQHAPISQPSQPNPADRYWTQTYTGKKFYPTQPDTDLINILDIAHSLSMQCRYNGHCAYFYSVAQHSVLIAQEVAKTHPEFALDALLHDATEAYVGDLVRPLKVQIPDFNTIEMRVYDAIAQTFHLNAEIPAIVTEYDNRILLDEREQLFIPSGYDWGINQEPLGITIDPWTQEQALTAFTHTFYRITRAQS